MFADEVDHVLKTGANWKGPIADFTLTIDKPPPDAILSLCESGLKKTGPTAFTTERAGFEPTQDIASSSSARRRRANNPRTRTAPGEGAA